MVYGEKKHNSLLPRITYSDEAEAHQVTISKGKKGSWAAMLAMDRHAMLLGVTVCG